MSRKTAKRVAATERVLVCNERACDLALLITSDQYELGPLDREDIRDLLLEVTQLRNRVKVDQFTNAQPSEAAA